MFLLSLYRSPFWLKEQIAPNNPPNVEFISAIELEYQKHLDKDALELRAETNCLLRKAKAPKSSITKEESKSLKELRGDQ